MLLPQVPVDISTSKVLRLLGQKDKSLPLPEHINSIVDEVVSGGKVLLHPTASWTCLAFSPEGFLKKASGEKFILPGFNNLTTPIHSASVIAVSVGETIDIEINDLFKQGNYLAATTLDALGTVAVEETANRVIKLLSAQKKSSGLFPTPRYIPGCREGELHCLPDLLEVAGANKVNIRCNTYFQLEPVKSLVFWVGWGPFGYSVNDKCLNCNKTNCKYRTDKREGEGSI